MRVYPEQLVTQEVGAILGEEYAQFLCKICNLVVHLPVVLPCAHMFCSGCFNDWVQKMRPNVQCPTCQQAVRPQEVVHFEGTRSGGGAMALLHRLYSGMKVRCAYHPDMGTKPPLTPWAARAKASHLTCSWRGAMHDYAGHLATCQVHAAVAGSPVHAGVAHASESSTAVQRASAGTAAPFATLTSSSSTSSLAFQGAFQALVPWHSQEAGALSVHQGVALWVTSTDTSGEWAYARVLQARHDEAQPHAWVPRAVLQRAVYPTCSVFDAQGQVQGLSLAPGNLVHVYHREASGWTYGARLERRSPPNGEGHAVLTPEEVGWFPEACIAEPLPVA